MGITFDLMFQKFLAELSSSGKVDSISKLFGPYKELFDMFKSIWNLKEAHSFLKITSIKYEKNKEKAANFRESGNKFYKDKCYYKALCCYNESLSFSPQNDIKSIKDVLMIQMGTCQLYKKSNKKFDFPDLALGYANRSAVLFEMKNYKSCLLDISRAIFSGYPVFEKVKIIERQIKCHLLLSREDFAQQLVKSYLAYIETDSSLFKKIQTILPNYESLAKSYDEKESKLEKQYKILFNSNILNPPPLNNSHASLNNAIPSLNDAVFLDFSSENGRFLRANRNIMPGEVLIHEKAFEFTLFSSAFVNHCFNCLLRTNTPIPCPFCSKVVFCCEKCCFEALEQCHFSQCKILAMLLELDLGHTANLSFQIVSRIPLQDLKKNVESYYLEDLVPLTLGFNNKFYHSDDYKPIHFLVSNVEHRSTGDLFKRAAIAFCFVKILLINNYFGSACMDEISENDIFFVGSILLKHLMSLPCNAHSIFEFKINTSNYPESSCEQIGGGAFAVMSLTNHSCNPNTARFNYGTVLINRAIRFIKEGEEITDTYGEHFATPSSNLLLRKMNLKKQYYFDCMCEACTENWPRYFEVPSSIFITCPKCSSNIELQSKAKLCSSCKTAFNKLKISKNNDGEFASLEEFNKKLENVYDNCLEAITGIVEGEIQAYYEGALCQFITYVSKYCKMPCLPLLKAEESLKHLYNLMGSSFYSDDEVK